MTAVADTSPLFALARLDLLHLLPDLFGETLVPPAVLAEAIERRPNAADARVIARAVAGGMLRRGEDVLPAELRAMPGSLGAGEREAIALASRIEGAWLVLDDRGARRYASGLGLSVVGIVRVLELARAAGAIDRVAPLLEDLRAGGFRLAGRFVDAVREAEQPPDP